MAMLKRDELTSVPTRAPATSTPCSAAARSSRASSPSRAPSGSTGSSPGTIVTNDVLVVGEGAKVSAEITCGTIIVHGEINGNVRAKNAVELHHPARMRGNIETPSLMIEKGVIFEGQCEDGGRREGRRREARRRRRRRSLRSSRNAARSRDRRRQLRARSDGRGPRSSGRRSRSAPRSDLHLDGARLRLGRFGRCTVEHAVLRLGADLLRVDGAGQRERPGEVP